MRLFWAALLAVGAASASAQGVPVPRDTVGDRLQDQLRAQGVRAGAWTFYPTLSADFRREDNLFATPDNEESDIVAVYRPAIDARANWTRHALEVGASASIGRYADNGSEDFNDHEVYARGRLELGAASSLSLSTRLSRLHEDRSSPDDRGGFTPTEFDRASFDVSYARSAGKISLEIDAGLTGLNYNDTQGAAGRINHDDRDRTLSDVAARVEYGLTDDTALFVTAGRIGIDYDDALDDTGFDRDAEELRFAVGANVVLAERTDLEAFIGVRRRDLDDARFADIDETWFGAELTHRVSGLTTLTASLSRDIRASSLPDAAGYVVTRLAGAIDHELMRNVVLRGELYTLTNDYRGIDREEDFIGGEIAALYLVNRYLDVRLRVRTRERDVDQSLLRDDDFEASTISLTLQGKL